MMQVRSLSNPLRIPDLRRRLLFTAFMLVLYRLGAHLPVPGVDVRALQQLFQQQGGLLSFYDLFVGGALSNFALFALGVFPYITASIIFSLLQVVFPRLKEMATEEGEAGRRKIGQYTRYLTVVLAILQGIGQMYLIRSQNAIPDARPLMLGTIVITLVAGTMLLTWMGEIMTEHGVGNGVSLIIFGGIVARLPDQIGRTIVLLRGHPPPLPMKLIQAGVIPIIFAISLLQFPQTIAQFGQWPWLRQFAALILPGGSYLGDALYFALIIVFTYFYTAVSFDPNDVANNIKKYGGFIPGIRPGRPTSEYLTRVTERLTFVGALVLGLIAVLPTLFRGPAALGGGTT